MNKKELISKITDTLRTNNVRKPISSPKKVFHISDDEGNSKDFIVKSVNKSVLYNSDDVSAVLDTCLEVITESIKQGESIYIHGFGTLGLHKRAARKTKHPETGKMIDVDARYVPKFQFGNILRMAAKIYELNKDDILNSSTREFE